MKTIDRRAVLAIAGGGLASACAAPISDIAGSSRKTPKGGIGGTGIVGTLTDFGSVMVNGLRVAVPADLTVSWALGEMAQDRLAIGQNLTIEAATEDGKLTARRVHVMHPVIGRIDDVSADGRRLVVAGVPVIVESGALSSALPGASVAVSGTWRDREVVASRIVPVSANAPVVAAGTVRLSVEGVRIGGLDVRLPDGITLQDGSFATVLGRTADAGLVADDVHPDRFTGAAGALTNLSVEGYLAPTKTAPFYTIDGLGHNLSAQSRVSGFVGKRVLLSGGYSGLFEVTEGQVLDETLPGRRAQLRVPG